MSEATQDAGATTSNPGDVQATEGAKAPEAGAATTQVTETTATETKAPEAAVVYEFKAPEGVVLDDKRVEKFTAIAKDLKLPADKAQALVDLATEVEVSRKAEHQQIVAKWVDEISNDKVLGGDKLDASLATAAKVYSLLPAEESQSLKDMLNVSGFGNHPSLIRLFHAVGNALSEDKFIPGTKGAGETSEAIAKRMYPNMNP